LNVVSFFNHKGGVGKTRSSSTSASLSSNSAPLSGVEFREEFNTEAKIIERRESWHAS